MTIAAANQGRFGAAFEWLGVERAWTRTRGSPDVVIGIVDEGVQLDHPLLGPNIQKDLDPPPHRGRQPRDSRHPRRRRRRRARERRGAIFWRRAGLAHPARAVHDRHRTPGARSRARHRIRGGDGRMHRQHLARGRHRARRRAARHQVCRRAQCAGGVFGAREAVAAARPAPNQINVLSIGEKFQALSSCPLEAAHLAAPGFARVPHWRGSGHSVLVGPAIGAPYVSGVRRTRESDESLVGLSRDQGAPARERHAASGARRQVPVRQRPQRGERGVGAHRARDRREVAHVVVVERCVDRMEVALSRRVVRERRRAVPAAWR